jgi:hypothetical protein
MRMRGAMQGGCASQGKADARDKIGGMREARQETRAKQDGRCARQIRAYARDKAVQIRKARPRRCMNQGRVDAQG